MTDERAEVTAAVTEIRKVEPWEAVGMLKETWDALEIPAFLRRSASPPIHPPSGSTTMATPAVHAPDADASDGPSNGSASKPPTAFDQFKAPLYDPGPEIAAEADRRWRDWMPTKTDRKRPRLRTMINTVRREWKQRGKI